MSMTVYCPDCHHAFACESEFVKFHEGRCPIMLLHQRIEALEGLFRELACRSSITAGWRERVHATLGGPLP